MDTHYSDTQGSIHQFLSNWAAVTKEDAVDFTTSVQLLHQFDPRPGRIDEAVATLPPEAQANAAAIAKQIKRGLYIHQHKGKRLRTHRLAQAPRIVRGIKLTNVYPTAVTVEPSQADTLSIGSTDTLDMTYSFTPRATS